MRNAYRVADGRQLYLFICSSVCTVVIRYGMLDREEKVRTKPQRTEKLEEERSEQLKAAVKPKEVTVVKSLD